MGSLPCFATFEVYDHCQASSTGGFGSCIGIRYFSEDVSDATGVDVNLDALTGLSPVPVDDDTSTCITHTSTGIGFCVTCTDAHDDDGRTCDVWIYW